MAKRLRVLRGKATKDRITAHKKNPKKQEHKVAKARSKKMKARMINRAR